MNQLVTCQYRQDPHPLDGECVSVTHVWLAYAARRAYRGEWRYEAFGTAERLRIISGGHVAPVTLTEATDGYYGWLATGADMPSMIRHSYPSFACQFPYGFQNEESVGHGRMVRLRIEERCSP